MHLNIKIKNKIYNIHFIVNDTSIHIRLFSINNEYRGRGYSRRIFNNIQSKYNKPIELECWFTLYDYYKKMGFVKDGVDENGYYLMKKI